MRRRDILLISSAISAGLLSASTKNSSPLLSNLTLVFTGISAYLATAPRINKRTRKEDKASASEVREGTDKTT